MSPEISLAELQRRFLAAVLPGAGTGGGTEGLASLAPLLKPATATAAEQVRIYRTNTRENFCAALAAAYPALRHHLGEEEFREMAWSCQRRHPARSGNLQDVGAGLPGFLAGALAGTGREALAELARLERAVQTVSFAADHAVTLDLAALARVPAGEHGGLRFHLDPAVALVATNLPVLHLWAAARGDTRVTTAPGPEHLLVRRQGRGVEVHRVAVAEFAWLEALAAGRNLEEALEIGLAAGKVDAAAGESSPASSLDLERVLVTWVQAGVITGFDRGSPGEP